MTAIQIIDAARDLLAEPLASTRVFPDDTSSYFADTTFLKYLNLEQQALANIIDQSYENYFVTSTMISLIANTAEYTLPTDFKKLIRLENVENSDSPIELTPITFNEKDTVVAHTISYGSPSCYAMQDNSIVLAPKPTYSKANAIKIYYVKRLDDLSAASSISAIPSEYHEVIVWGIVKRAMFQQQAVGEAMVDVVTEYRLLVNEMKKSIENRQVHRPRSVRRRKGY